MRRRRWVIPRALVRDMVPALLLAVTVTTFLLVIRSFFMLADLFISNKSSATVALQVLLYTVPHVIALTIPIAVLFSVLITASRWSADSELIALQAGGISLSRAARPLLLLGAMCFLADLYVSWTLLPAANIRLQRLSMEIALSGVRTAVEPRVFIEEFPGLLLYVDRVDRDRGTWNGVLLFDTTSEIEERLVVADTGELVADPRSGSAWLNLQDATTHLVRPDSPEDYRRNPNNQLQILLDPSKGSATSTRSVGVRETASKALLARHRDPAETSERREAALLELHKRVSIPAAALVFALVGFPLGARSRRGGRGFAFTLSVALVVVYYVLLSMGEIIASAQGLEPAFGVWLPNLVLTVVALLLLPRVNAGYKGGGPGGPAWWQRLGLTFRRGENGLTEDDPSSDSPVSTKVSERPGAPGDGATSAARPRIFLPPPFGIIDRNMIGQCLAFFALVLLTISAIYVAVNLSETMDEIQKNRPPFMVVSTYYVFTLPQILHDILPLAFVIAFLGTAVILERHNETTALKAAGISLTRATAPLLLLSALVGVGLFLLDEVVVQRASRSGQRLNDIIKGRKVARSYRATDRPWLFLPDGRTLVNFLQYDPDTDTLLRPSVYVFGPRFHLRARYMAESASFVDGAWKGDGVWSRRFLADGTPDFVRHALPINLPIGAPPAYFGREYRQPQQMRFEELRDYIATLKAAGYRVDRLEVQLHQKLAYPVSVIVLSWLALPFAFRARRRGTVVGIALALAFGMAYFALMAFTTKLGESNLIEPLLGAWTPPVVFALLALNRNTLLRT